jgi:hypothetical protein
MATLNSQPENMNYVSPVGFQFSIKKMPNVNWFVQAANIPGVTLGEALHNMPPIDQYLPGEKLTYDPLNLTFKVDEDFTNWMELKDWMIGLGAPEGSEQFRKYVGDPQINVDRKFSTVRPNPNQATDAYMSDATLVILNSNMNPNFEITFKDMFPTSISELNFDTTLADVEYITATATFRYISYTYRKIDR